MATMENGTIPAGVARLARKKPGNVARLAANLRRRGDVDRAAQLEGVLTSLGRCRLCGRVLSDAHSVSLGVGPECWKFGHH